MIISWSGAVGAIPYGFALCDGTNGTPDLRDRFIVGAGGAYAVGATGGSASHKHNVTESSVAVDLNAGIDVASSIPTGSYEASAGSHDHSVATQFADGRSPYYALCKIMKL
jgi:hypothetical protein